MQESSKLGKIRIHVVVWRSCRLHFGERKQKGRTLLVLVQLARRGKQPSTNMTTSTDSCNAIDIIRKCRSRIRFEETNDDETLSQHDSNKTREHQFYYTDKLTADEIQWWISQYSLGNITDYQMSAWLMAVCFNGLSREETAILTRCMVESGVQLQWPTNRKELQKMVQSSDISSIQDQDLLQFVDKHSSGGVGDKVSIVLAPLVASMGLYVPMIAGRGLGHTGGTIDKLESIKGMNVHLSMKQFQSIVINVGCCITSATTEICPADSKLYALRDVTCTVSSIPLQTSSIMCKKIAENPNSIVLDVKYGTGSFQSTLNDAIALAKNMISIGEYNGLQPTTALVTKMDTPLGCSVGNFLELFECIYIMVPSSYPSSIKTIDDLKEYCFSKETNTCSNDQLRVSYDLIELILVQAAQMIYQSNQTTKKSYNDCMSQSFESLRNGYAFTKFKQMISAQNGDTETIEKCVLCIDQYNNLDSSATGVSRTVSTVIPSLMSNLSHNAASVHVLEWKATANGFIQQIDALIVGQVCVELLHTGRLKQDDTIHHYTGIWFCKQYGDFVSINDTLGQVYFFVADEDESKHSISDKCVLSPENSSIPAFVSKIIERLNASVMYTFDKPTDTRKPTYVTHRVTSERSVEEFSEFL
jgi:pyrimidine-nucleoside phosphorylase